MGRHWAVMIPADLWASERLFHHDSVRLPGTGPVAGDDILLVAGDGRHAVALGSARESRRGTLLVSYIRRAFDDPVHVDDLKLMDAVTPLDPETFAAVATRLTDDRAARQTWLVSLDLPIEASSPAEAVRQFWSYVSELGPAELPAFVSPSGNELAMQAFVLGAEANLDPEEDED
jgi:hypothetical protein